MEREVGERDIELSREENWTLLVRLGAVEEWALIGSLSELVEECCGEEAAIVTVDFAWSLHEDHVGGARLHSRVYA